MLFKKNLIILIYIFLQFNSCLTSNFTIMLDTPGSTKNTGRKLYQSFERGATLQFAQALKRQIEITYPHVNAILFRTAGQASDKLQNANFANRLNIDLLLHLSFYQETSIRPNIFLYQFKNQHFFNTNPNEQLTFYPYDQAFMINFDKTKQWIGLVQKSLQNQNYKHYFACHNSLAIPFKPLRGIICPAIGIEIGIKDHGWDPYIMPIVNSLSEVIYAL